MRLFKGIANFPFDISSFPLTNEFLPWTVITFKINRFETKIVDLSCIQSLYLYYCENVIPCPAE